MQSYTALLNVHRSLHHVRSVQSRAVEFTAFLFILLQSDCTASMAISGLRLLIGIGSFAAAAAAGRTPFMVQLFGFRWKRLPSRAR